jgi:hypothetical protein
MQLILTDSMEVCLELSHLKMCIIIRKINCTTLQSLYIYITFFFYFHHTTKLLLARLDIYRSDLLEAQKPILTDTSYLYPCNKSRSRDSSVSIAIFHSHGLDDRGFRVQFPVGARYFPLSIMFRQALEPNQPPIW